MASLTGTAESGGLALRIVEEIFGWMKTVGLLRKTRHRGVAQVGWMCTFAAAVYTLVQMRSLAAVA